eukprot:scaffold9164_cov29-Tisochrysis_lutea.AAC.3
MKTERSPSRYDFLRSDRHHTPRRVGCKAATNNVAEDWCFSRASVMEPGTGDAVSQPTSSSPENTWLGHLPAKVPWPRMIRWMAEHRRCVPLLSAGKEFWSERACQPRKAKQTSR